MDDLNDAPGEEGARPAALTRQKRWQLRNPAARQTHLKVGAARASGKLVPQACEWPGCSETKVDAHHEDYAQPLKVTWLCRKHHKARHRQMRRMAKDG